MIKPMIVYVFGNPDLPADSLPLRILPELEKKFPQVQFVVKDPNEEWDVPEELTVIDTVEGIKDVTVFHDLTKFAAAPRVTMHDFDALANLRYLQKLGKIKKVTIIGIPSSVPENEALQKVAVLLERVRGGQ
jgi:hypothetical protein